MLYEEMERITQILGRQALPPGVIQAHLKEALQYYVLDFIYNSPFNKKFIFTGGSCLRICYGLNRLSEDLDFDVTEAINIQELANALHGFFAKTMQYPHVEFAIKGKHDKLYLKFPILKSLRLSGPDGSDKLYVKVETSPVPFKKYQTELTPIDREKHNFLLWHYDLPTLMAGKIHAIFHRIYFKGKANEITFKGRDVYDLAWYLEKGIHPNMEAVYERLGISREEILYKEIEGKIKAYKPEHLAKDLENLFDNPHFIKNWTEHFKTLLSKHLRPSPPPRKG